MEFIFVQVYLSIYNGSMAQLNLYIKDELLSTLKSQASEEGDSLSAYVTKLLERKAMKKKWDKTFMKTLGTWVGDLEEPVELPFEKRDTHE